jgi:hypothetical protein
MRWFVVLLAVMLQDKPKPKELPVVKYTIPLAIDAHVKELVTLRGARLDGVKSVSTTEAGVVLRLIGEGKKAGVPNNYPVEKLGDTSVVVEVEIHKSFKGTAVPITVKDANGESLPYYLTVSSTILKEVEPNDEFSKAQKLSLPITVDGVLQKERDIDLFQLHGKKDQELTVAIHAAKLGSPADVMLTLYDSRKQILKIVDDTDKSSDPSFIIKLPADGVYFLAVMEANDMGGAQFGYRLLVK